MAFKDKFLVINSDLDEILVKLFLFYFLEFLFLLDKIFWY